MSESQDYWSKPPAGMPENASTEPLAPAPEGAPAAPPSAASGSAPTAPASTAANLSGVDQQNVDPEALAAIRNLEERRKQAKRKRTIKIIIAACIVAALIGSCAVGNVLRSASSTAVTKQTTETVVREDITTTVQATGSLKPGTRVSVTPEVSGVIEEVMVTEGQHVEAGDPLFTLKNTELDKAVDEASSAVNRAQRSVNSAQTGVSNAWDAYNGAIDAYNSAVDAVNNSADAAAEAANKAYEDAYNTAVSAIPSTATEAERNKLMAEARDTAQAAYDAAYKAATPEAPSSFDHSTYISAIDTAQDAQAAAEESLQDAQRNYDYAMEEAEKRTVRAPISGTVLDLKAEPGVAVGGAKGGTSTVSDALMQIADLNSLSVDVEVNEVDIANVAPGEKANVTFTAIPGLSLEGSIASVASVASGSSGTASEGTSTGGGVVTYKVTTVLKGTDPRLKPGMSSSVSIVTKELPNALVIPSAAVTEDENGASVKVVTDEKTLATEQRSIVIAERTGTQVIVESGLQEGESVLIETTSTDGQSSSSSSTR